MSKINDLLKNLAARFNVLEVSETVSNCSLVVCLFSEIKFPELDEYLQKFQVCTKV